MRKATRETGAHKRMTANKATEKIGKRKIRSKESSRVLMCQITLNIYVYTFFCVAGCVVFMFNVCSLSEVSTAPLAFP